MIELIRTFFFLFAVIDPLGSIPIFLEATRQFDHSTRKKVAIKATIIAACILLFFILLGQIIMETMHITLSAFQIAGGLILFLFALTMVFGHGKAEEEKHLIKDYQHVTVFPIAIPSIASPGAIMAVVMLTDNYTFSFMQQLMTTSIVMVVLFVTGLMLLAAQKIQGRIGETGILVITKIMGLLLASFAIQSILTGITGYFNI